MVTVLCTRDHLIAGYSSHLLSYFRKYRCTVQLIFFVFVVSRYNSTGGNYVVTRDMYRSENNSKWRINGKNATMKEVHFSVYSLAPYSREWFVSIVLCLEKFRISICNCSHSFVSRLKVPVGCYLCTCSWSLSLVSSLQVFVLYLGSLSPNLLVHYTMYSCSLHFCLVWKQFDCLLSVLKLSFWLWLFFILTIIFCYTKVLLKHELLLYFK